MNLISENPKATITVIVSAVMVVVAYLLKSIWGIELPSFLLCYGFGTVDYSK